MRECEVSFLLLFLYLRNEITIYQDGLVYSTLLTTALQDIIHVAID